MHTMYLMVPALKTRSILVPNQQGHVSVVKGDATSQVGREEKLLVNDVLRQFDERVKVIGQLAVDIDADQIVKLAGDLPASAAPFT